MRISQKLLYLFLIPAALMTLAFPARLFAQTQPQPRETTGLNFILLDNFYYNSLKPGESKTLYLNLENTGNTTVTNISFSSPDKPEGWIVTFKPASIDSLKAGLKAPVDVNIVPAPGAVRDDHTIVLIATADQTRAVASTTIHIENGFSSWQWVGVGIGILVLAAFLIVFRRFGRD